MNEMGQNTSSKLQNLINKEMSHGNAIENAKNPLDWPFQRIGRLTEIEKGALFLEEKVMELSKRIRELEAEATGKRGARE